MATLHMVPPNFKFGIELWWTDVDFRIDSVDVHDDDIRMLDLTNIW